MRSDSSRSSGTSRHTVGPRLFRPDGTREEEIAGNALSEFRTRVRGTRLKGRQDLDERIVATLEYLPGMASTTSARSQAHHRAATTASGLEVPRLCLRAQGCRRRDGGPGRILEFRGNHLRDPSGQHRRCGVGSGRHRFGSGRAPRRLSAADYRGPIPWSFASPILLHALFQRENTVGAGEAARPLTCRWTTPGFSRPNVMSPALSRIARRTRRADIGCLLLVSL